MSLRVAAIAKRSAAIAIKVVCSRWLHLGLALAALAWFVRPELLVRRARDDARACLAQTRAPRGPELPNCAPLVREFDEPTDYQYTRHDATYRAEELLARVAMDRYLDAAVGSPDPTRLSETAWGVIRAQEMLENGSRRISLEELGPRAPAPNLGKLASSIGDRAALLDHQDYFQLWYTRRDVVEAALLEADFDEVEAVAERYAELQPTEADLRTTLGAVLCIVAPTDGHHLLSTVPATRAEKRYANIQRNYGEVFAVLEACAGKIGAVEPVLPKDNYAGEADAAEVRMLSLLRNSAPGPERKRRVEAAAELLRGDAPGRSLDPKARYARAMLVAAVLALGEQPVEAAALSKMTTPLADAGEPPLGPKGLSLLNLLDAPPGLQPVVPVRYLELAAKRVEEAANKAQDDARQGLERAAAGLHNLAAIELANAGEPALAVQHAAAAARLHHLSARAAALSVASAAYVAGDPQGALAALDGAPEASASDAPALILAYASLRTLLIARSGDGTRAATYAAELPKLASGSASADAELQARWIALAFAPEVIDREGGPNLRSTGQADRLGRFRERGAPAIRSTLAAWADALEASSESRRAFRFELLDHRGDVPPAELGYFLAAQRLVDPSTEGAGIETWLDSLTAIDSRRMRLRSYAWLRMEAAKIRGDALFAELWQQRLTVLRQVANDESDLEATRFLRF